MIACSFVQKPTGCIEVHLVGRIIGYIDVETESGKEWFFFPLSTSAELSPVTSDALLAIVEKLEELNE